MLRATSETVGTPTIAGTDAVTVCVPDVGVETVHDTEAGARVTGLR